MVINWFIVLAVVLFIYGGFCMFVGVSKLSVIWEMKKIQIFRKILTDIGTQIFVTIWGVIAIGGGIAVLIFT